MTNWKDFREHLTENLERNTPPKEILNTLEFENAVSFLIKAIQDMIEETVPKSKPVPYTKRWWSSDLSHMKKEKNWLNHRSYIHRACEDHPSHKELREFSKCYAKAIQAAKTQHWEQYLEDMDKHHLWGANRYLSSPASDGGKAKLPTLLAKDATGTVQRVETNEEKSRMLSRAFFPPKPSSLTTPERLQYPERVPY